MKLSDILYLISEIPAEKRQGFLQHMGQQIDNIPAYHVTSQAAATKIKIEGMKAQSSSQSYDRPDATYFFLDCDEIDDENRAILLDNPSDFEIIEVLIPHQEFLNKVQWDGLYNASFNTSRSAIQFFGDIPADWIIN